MKRPIFVSMFVMVLIVLSVQLLLPTVGTAQRDAVSVPDDPFTKLSGQSALQRATPTLVPSPTLGPTETPMPLVLDGTGSEPLGCMRPPDDYSRLIVNGGRLNYRTFWMLKRAKGLYKGTIDFTGWAITQGSYNPGGVKASFGTHDAGGAVDLSVINPKNGNIFRTEIPDAIRALRVAGFAAWLRERNELYVGSPIHSHAIAIGDAELSPAARDQLTGQFGYFLGFNGLPQTDAPPIPDRHGGPILCKWMLDMGYRDLRNPGSQGPGG